MTPADAHPFPRRALAFGVHVLTACGAALALLALLAAIERRWGAMFVWLGLALVVDAVDGPLARLLEVKTVLPRWSGDVLDLVVDIIAYVFVPAYALVAGDLLPQPLAIPLGLLVVITGTLYFADRRMKSADNYFFGFPAVWNAVAFYLFLFRPEPWCSALSVAALATMTFLPVPFVHPLRVQRLRGLSVALLALWAALALVAVIRNLSPGPWVSGGLCAIGLYFLAAGLLRRSAQ
jgi:phosphatidylcholine synthase